MSSEHSTLKAVAAIVESISGVGVSDLGPETDLLDLGLDSLMFVRIGRVLEGRYQVSISMKRFYDELSNLGALAAFLAANGTEPEAAGTRPQQTQPSDTAPMSAAVQQARPAPDAAACMPVPLPTLAGETATVDVNTVMSAHMALMRRYLDGLAAGSHGAIPASATPRLHLQTAVTSAAVQDHIDAIETRRKFSGIVTQKEALSAQQLGFIEALATRLSARCPRSKQMAEAGKAHLSDWKYSLQFKQDLKELRFPVVCETAAGSRFIDVDGNEYIDIAMGMGVHYFGHSPRFVDDAVRAQLDRNQALGPQSKLAPDVARRICALTGHERAAFFVTGSDAVMLALRLVRAARARDKVVTFAGAYHGICSDILAGQGESGPVPMSPGLPPGIVNDLVVLDYDAPESLERIRALADQLAGVLVEPVQSRNPALQPQRFLRQLRALCTELEIPLIFDEMVNGFRQAPGGMQEWFGVKADLSTYGKIIGGGYPLSVIAGNADLMQWIDGGVWRYGDDSAPYADSIATGGTHNKHPLALAAAAAVLDHIESNRQLYPAVRMRMHALADRCNVWFERNAVPLRLTYFGTQFKFENFASALELELFFYLLLEQGIYTWELHVANLSTEHTQDDLNQLFAAIVQAVQQLRAGGFAFHAAKLRRQYVPMSSVQKRLYAITQRKGAEKPYHLAGAWRLRGSVDAARLEDCIHQVIIRHESLRTAFVVVDGEFYQRIVPEPRFFLDHIDAAGRSAEELLDDYIQPFNLLEPPLLRVGLAHLDAETRLLLMDVHHIVADGLSMNIVLQEVLALYDGILLEPVRSQARHVQEAIANYLAGEQATQDARYWQQTLAPFVVTQDGFDLSADFSRPPVTDFAGKRLALKLDTAATTALHSFCKQQRISTFAALFAVFVAWTWRYARQPQFIVGLPGSGRPDGSADHAVGMFVNTLAFPARVDAHSSVSAFLQQIRDTLFEVQEHGDYPFSALLAGLGISYRANRNPLFDVMFSYENAGSREVRTAAFVGETLTQYEGAGMFDVSLDLIEAENSILINCAYAESLFTEATMASRMDTYLALLQALVADTAGTLAEWVQAAGKSGAGRRSAAVQILHPGARAQAAVPAATLHALWLQQVARAPQNIALIEGSQALSYAAVGKLVEETAFTLFNLYGIRAGDRVVVSLDSSIDLVVVMLALFSMGAVYVPVTPDTPAARVRAILQICRAPCLIHTDASAFADTIRASTQTECVAITAIRNSAIATTRHQSLLPPQPEDLAYVIFTSGSTGLPKGVEIQHAGISNAVSWRMQAYGMGQADCTLQMPSMAFDASLIDILSALCSGGRLVLLESAAKRSVERIADEIRQHGVTAVLLTPTLYRVLLERIPETVAALRFVTLAGEALSTDLMHAHFRHAAAVDLWNEYGPTECSVVVSGGRMTADQQSVHIGWPVSNLQVHILDEHEQPAPHGVWGRLWVSGIGLARGYAGDDAATARKFRCLPALGELRCYDTGDIVRQLDSGVLEFKGRDDAQVKVNGYRIELEEVETALRSQLGFTEVAAAVVDKGTSASLQAWVVAAAVPEHWREALQSVLPPWMVPAALHAVQGLPLLPSGKLDRKSLLALQPLSAATKAAGTVPETPVADGSALALLLGYCREILGRQDLQPGDNYFNVGGDSIQAIVLASRLHEAGHLLDVNDLFRHPVLADLARRIVLKGSRTLPQLQSASAALPSPMQSWFFEACTGDPDAFTQAAWLRLPADMTLAQLQVLCRHWASQHAVFQETVALMQARAAMPDTALPLERLVNCSEPDGKVEPEALALAARAQISLRAGPLMNVRLLRQAGASRALVVFHHFVVDAVSWQLLQTQWAQLWDDLTHDRPLRALPEAATVHQFVSTLHSEAVRTRALQELPFWQSLPARAEPAFAACEQTAAQHRGQRVHASALLDPASAELLLATGHGLFRTRGSELLLAAFTDALARVCKLERVALLLESNGRAQRYVDADFSATLGWMTSAYPLVVDTSGAASGRDWSWKVERLRELLQRVPEQGLGYGVLRYVLKHAALPALAPQIAFNYLGRFRQHPDHDFAILDETPAGDVLGELGLLPALECVCFADDAGIHIMLSADADLIGAAKLDSILQTFRQQALDLAAACRSLATPVLPAPVDFVDSDWRLDEYLALLEANALQRSAVATIVPLTAMQHSLVFHARSKPEDLAYLEQVDFTLHGVAAGALAAAFQRLLDLYPLLRAGFVTGPGGRRAQLIMNGLALPIVEHDLSALAPEQQQAVIDAARLQDQATRFDIARPPLMRVQLFTLQAPDRKQKSRGSVHVIWTHHHLLMDGWCVGILVDQLLRGIAQTDGDMAQAAAKEVAQIAAANMQLAQDYFSWLAARDRSQSIAWWSSLLAGVEQPTRLVPWPRLPTEPLVARDAGYQLQQYMVQLPAELVAGMQTWGASRSATLSSVLRLTWAVLLARFTNSADVVFGTVVSGRPADIAGIERAVGLFINTVPLRFRLDAQISGNDALSLLQEQANTSRAHDYLSLAEIQQAAPDLRAREPLFDHLIVLENYPMDAALRGAGNGQAAQDATSITNIRAFERTDLPLNLVIVPVGAGLDATFLFDAAVYPLRQIEHLAAHFVQLAQRLIEAPQQALAALDLLTHAEHEWLSGQWNQRQASYPVDCTLFDLFREAALQHGERCALRDEAGSMSYAALQAQVLAVAGGLLRNRAFRPGQRVALWLPRNREMVIGMLAVLAAGGCYVPLDPVYPEERIRFIIEDSEAVLVLHSMSMPALAGSTVCLTLADLAQHTADPGTLPQIGQDAAAYVIYTSGSTGQPKGCAITHRNLVRLLRNDRFDFDFDHEDVWVVAHSFCFDFSVWEMYGALVNGACLLIPAAAQVRDTEAFVELVAQHKVSVLNQTPAAFYQFSKVALKAAPDALAALRLVVFGGDSLACNRLAPWIERFPTSRVKLVNMYGITETTVHVTYREISTEDVLAASPLNCVGRPLPETQVWIVDRCGQLQPPGIAGEIVVAGSGVSAGYINRPELTARKFAALTAAGAAHCYWSGDLGYVCPELGLVYLGRNDHQVQVRGFRVECEEIARCLELHQSVDAALVLPVENAHGTELVAYLVGDEAAAPAQWRRWLASRLPEYMVPSWTLWLDALPLTGNGKLDRAALPDPLSVVAAPELASSSDVEALIISAWQRVLQREQIGPLSNFFDNGGHSLKALTLADLLQSEYGVIISVGDIFEHPTPRQQAARCTVTGSAAAPAVDALDALLDDIGLDDLEALLADLPDQHKGS